MQVTPPEITVVGDAELSDAAIIALAALLLSAAVDEQDDETSRKDGEKKTKATSLN